MDSDDQHTERLGSWTRAHYRQVIVIRAVLSAWILFVTVFLCAKGYWWGLLFIPFFALDAYLLRSVLRYARTQND